MIASIDCKLPPCPVGNFQWPTGISLHTFLVYAQNTNICEPFSLIFYFKSIAATLMVTLSFTFQSKKGVSFFFWPTCRRCGKTQYDVGRGICVPSPCSIGDIKFVKSETKISFCYKNQRVSGWQYVTSDEHRYTRNAAWVSILEHFLLYI